MLKKKIIASSVGNLTDARYFAGWMVDFIHFDLGQKSNTPIDAKEIGAIQSWIEGPQYLLSTDKEEEQEQALVTYGAHGIIQLSSPSNLENDWMYFIKMKQSELANELESVQDYHIILTEISDYQSLAKLSQDHELSIYIDTQPVNVPSDKLLEDWIQGYVVHGSPEEKVGFKSFDELDIFFEAIEDMD